MHRLPPSNGVQAMKSRQTIFLLYLVVFFVSSAFAANISPVGKVRVDEVAKDQKAVESPGPVPEKKKDRDMSSNGDKHGTGKKEASQQSTNASDDKKVSDKKQDPLKKQNNKQIKPGKKLAYNRSPNSFNRLLKPPSKRNPSPAKDGIHDPDNDGTHILQAPKDSFSQLTKSNSGNRVDWVAAIEKGEINPRFDRLDPEKVPIILDLNIVREVKGSMPDVVYPHKQHTEWLDCSNCHPAIFVPMKGANNISMASILLGEKCGVCHGKVAFPVSECRKCHSKNKTE
ncbi:MAG: c(7)-type cytochrome triheme domain-containing protein [Candidatus Thiodiazotropha endolucinida]